MRRRELTDEDVLRELDELRGEVEEMSVDDELELVPLPSTRDAARRSAANDRSPLAKVASAALLLAILGLPGCAALEAFIAGAAPVAGQVAASTLAQAVADARACPSS